MYDVRHLSCSNGRVDNESCAEVVDEGGTEMKEETMRTTDEALTRRGFLKGGAGAVLVASCLPALGRSVAMVAAPATRGTRAKLYVCPPCGQDCDKLTFDQPGKCPVCGMTLIEKSQADKSP